MNPKYILVILGASMLLGWSVYLWNRSLDSVAQSEVRPIFRRPEMRPRLPVPHIPGRMTRSELPVDEATATNALAPVFSSTRPTNLDPDQIESYLQNNHRSAASLLTAFRLTGQTELLREAVEKFPQDPQVAFAMLYQSKSEEERRLWLERFKLASPENALPVYLSALDYFKTGQNDLAVRELIAASSQARWEDYLSDSMRNTEEAYLSAGYTEAEAKALASTGLEFPNLADMRELGRRLAEISSLYQQAGDSASAQAVLQMGLTLGYRLGEESGRATMIQSLVAIAVQRQVLDAMDPATPCGDSGQTVKDRLQALAQRKEEIKEIGKQANTIMKSMSESDLVQYFDRLKESGEEAALRWALHRQNQP